MNRVKTMTARCCLALLLLLSSCVGGHPDPAGEWVKELDQAPAGPRVGWLGTVVNASTREPIAGATVSIMAHEFHPTPDLLRALYSAVTDADGAFVLPDVIEEPYEYCVADAPGYAPSTSPRVGDSIVELWPGEDVPILLLDHVGRPVPGARVGYNHGCGHIPDHRTAVTDARGRAVLRNIDPVDDEADIWVEKDGLHRGTTRLFGPWYPGDPPVVVHCSSGVVVEGRVLGRDGEGVAGALVGTRICHRPWVRTNADGEFRLVGVAPYAFIGVDPGTGEWREKVGFTAPPSGVRRTFVLPEGEPEALVALRVIVETKRGAPVRKTTVVAVRATDGWTAADTYGGADGSFDLKVPLGKFEIRVDGRAGPFGSAVFPAAITPDGPRGFRVTVPDLPRLRVGTSRLPDEDLSFMLTTQTCWRRFSLKDLADGFLPVPLERPASIRVAGWGLGGMLVEVISIPPSGTEAFERGLDLKWAEARTVTARIATADGTPAAGWISLSRFPGSGCPSREELEQRYPPTAEPEEAIRDLGTVEVFIVSEDPALASRRRFIRIRDDSPERIDLGEIRLKPAPRGPILKLLVPENPEGWYDVYCWKDRLDHWWTAGPDGVVGVPEGVLEEGDVIVLGDQSGDLPELKHRLEGPGPWTVRWPWSRVGLEIRVADGEVPKDARVLIDGRDWMWFDWEVHPTHVVLSQALLPGPHELTVSMPGCRTQLHRVVLKDGEDRTIEVVLNRER
jgi:hypothetical protein